MMKLTIKSIKEITNEKLNIGLSTLRDKINQKNI